MFRFSIISETVVTYAYDILSLQNIPLVPTSREEKTASRELDAALRVVAR